MPLRANVNAGILPAPIERTRAETKSGRNTQGVMAGTGGTNDKVNGKRAQNRISQRCAREKKLTENRNMSTFVDLLKRTRTGTKEGETTLVDAYMALMEENE